LILTHFLATGCQISRIVASELASSDWEGKIEGRKETMEIFGDGNVSSEETLKC